MAAHHSTATRRTFAVWLLCCCAIAGSFTPLVECLCPNVHRTSSIRRIRFGSNKKTGPCQATSVVQQPAPPNKKKKKTTTPIPKRWFGNTKHKITDWSEIPKSKRTTLTLRDAQDDDAAMEFRKHRGETLQHVLVMAVLWKLFRPEYPHMRIDTDIGDDDSYIPDVVATKTKINNNTDNPSQATTTIVDKDAVVFWGESGRMSVTKACALCRRYPNAHIVQCRWGMTIDQYGRDTIRAVQQQQELINRPGRFTLASIRHDVWHYIDAHGNINISKDDLEWKEVLPAQ